MRERERVLAKKSSRRGDKIHLRVNLQVVALLLIFHWDGFW